MRKRQDGGAVRRRQCMPSLGSGADVCRRWRWCGRRLLWQRKTSSAISSVLCSSHDADPNTVRLLDALRTRTRRGRRLSWQPQYQAGRGGSSISGRVPVVPESACVWYVTEPYAPPILPTARRQAGRGGGVGTRASACPTTKPHPRSAAWSPPTTRDRARCQASRARAHDGLRRQDGLHGRFSSRRCRAFAWAVFEFKRSKLFLKPIKHSISIALTSRSSRLPHLLSHIPLPSLVSHGAAPRLPRGAPPTTLRRSGR